VEKKVQIGVALRFGDEKKALPCTSEEDAT